MTLVYPGAGEASGHWQMGGVQSSSGGLVLVKLGTAHVAAAARQNPIAVRPVEMTSVDRWGSANFDGIAAAIDTFCLAGIVDGTVHRSISFEAVGTNPSQDAVLDVSILHHQALRAVRQRALWTTPRPGCHI